MRSAVTSTSIMASLIVAFPAQACIDIAPFRLEDARFADAIVVGRISNYRIIEDLKARSDRDKSLARPDVPPDFRKSLENQRAFLSDYAAFDIDVEQTIAGKVPKRFPVTWDNSTFSEPEIFPAGPYLIALRSPHSNIPPLRGGSATILPNQRPQLLTVLQAPCSGTFILDNTQENIVDVRKVLRGEAVPDRNFSLQVVEDRTRIARNLAATRAEDLKRKSIFARISAASLALLLAIWIYRRRKAIKNQRPLSGPPTSTRNDR